MISKRRWKIPSMFLEEKNYLYTIFIFLNYSLNFNDTKERDYDQFTKIIHGPVLQNKKIEETI